MNQPGNFALVTRKVGDLTVDPKVQRSIKPHRVKNIAADFNPSALGVITTSFRSPDLIHIIDGQHRYEAAKTVDYDGPIQTMQYHGLSVPEEAALFRMLNDADSVSVVDQFLLSCVEENPDSLKLAGFLKAHGWEIGPSTTDKKISAIRALQRVYSIEGTGPTAVDRTLGTVTAAWGRRAPAVQGSILEGIGKVYARYDDNVSIDTMIKKLSGFPGGPEGLVGMARGQVVTRSGNLSQQVARLVVQAYNVRQRANVLEEWK